MNPGYCFSSRLIKMADKGMIVTEHDRWLYRQQAALGVLK